MDSTLLDMRQAKGGEMPEFCGFILWMAHWYSSPLHSVSEPNPFPSLTKHRHQILNPVQLCQNKL